MSCARPPHTGVATKNRAGSPGKRFSPGTARKIVSSAQQKRPCNLNAIAQQPLLSLGTKEKRQRTGEIIYAHDKYNRAQQPSRPSSLPSAPFDKQKLSCPQAPTNKNMPFVPTRPPLTKQNHPPPNYHPVHAHQPTTPSCERKPTCFSLPGRSPSLPRQTKALRNNPFRPSHP